MSDENPIRFAAMFDDRVPAPLLDALALGGPVAWLLLLLSVIALTIVLFKWAELQMARRGGTAVLQALAHWHAGRRAQALGRLDNARQSLPRVVRLAMHGRLTQVSDAVLREEIQRIAAAEMERLRTHLRTLEVIGQIGPLLGLFGTVLGMIEAFRRMEEAGARVDPSVLSGGIWQALLTTGVGLAVAIPVILAHQWLERRSDAHAHRMEDAVTQVFTSELHESDASTAASRTGSLRADDAHAN